MNAIISRRLSPATRAKAKPELYERRAPVTVCIAALFRWNYAPIGKPDAYKIGAITMSDRMITAGDVQYQPPTIKMGTFGTNIAVLCAGDLSQHSEALQETRKTVVAGTLPQRAAILYGNAMRAVRLRRAENEILAPLGLNTDSFLAQQSDMTPSFVANITNQLQTFKTDDAEALVVGADGNGDFHIYEVDPLGNVNCLDDVGFGAIGIGAWHAKSRLMQAGYVNRALFTGALASCFYAKRGAEIAPGVGRETDIHLCLSTGIEMLDQRMKDHVEALYDEYTTEHQKLVAGIVEKLITHGKEIYLSDASAGLVNTNAPSDVGSGEAAAEVAHGDEKGTEAKSDDQ